MYFIAQKSDIEITNIVNFFKKHLKNGSIVLSSEFNSYLYRYSPSPIRHISIVEIVDNDIFICDISDQGFRRNTLFNFVKKKHEMYILDFYDKEIMNYATEFIDKYKNYSYGFFGDNRTYCFEFIYDLYNDSIFKKYSKRFSRIRDFFEPRFSIFGKDFLNSSSFVNSKYFKINIALIDKYLVKFGKKV